MDAATFRWVLIAIAVLVAVGIYFYGQHQSRLRRRSAIDTFTRDEIDSAFVEDEQLRSELDNLNQIMRDDESGETAEDLKIDDVVINPVEEKTQQTPFTLPDPELFEHPSIAGRDPTRLISYHLRHDDFRLMLGSEIEAAVRQAGLELNDEGILEYRDKDTVAFRVLSLSEPGDFVDYRALEFKTCGLNCYIDLDDCDSAREAYEALLRKVDEMVRVLNVKVYTSDQQLLTISDVTETRKSFS